MLQRSTAFGHTWWRGIGVSRAQKLFLAVVMFMMLATGLLVWRNRQPPFLPDDEFHFGPRTAENCMTCHGPQGDLPQGRNHPLGRDCGRCHGSP